VYRLRISCASAYPDLIRRCEQAITEVLPVKVNKTGRQGCFEVYSFSKHWICLFPQHGPGRKHERKIELTSWQQDLIEVDPRPLLRGLLHSDGCRVLNRVKGTPYPRYHFINRSPNIRAIFGKACDALGIEWRPHNRFSLSVARRDSVALLDAFVGPKRRFVRRTPRLLASARPDREGGMTLNATRVECGTLGTDACAYRMVAEQLPDVAVLVFDWDLRFELATGAAVGDTGWTPEEVLGRTLLELLPPGRVEPYAAAYRAALAGERQSFEVEGSRAPGTVWASTRCRCAAPTARSPAGWCSPPTPLSGAAPSGSCASAARSWPRRSASRGSGTGSRTSTAAPA
jgi:PAS domain-containing protein